MSDSDVGLSASELGLSEDLPSSISATVDDLHSSFSSLSDQIAIASLLTDLTTALDSHHTHHILTHLQATVDLLTSQHASTSTAWLTLSTHIAHDSATLTEQSVTLTSSLSSTQHHLDSLSSQLTSASHADSLYFSRLSSLSTPSDLTLLPRHVLLHNLLPFLRPRDLSRSLTTCRRWHAHLNRGPHWQLLLLPVVRHILHQRANQQSSASASCAPPPPPTFTLTFNPTQLNPRPKSLLTKADALRHALAMHQRKVDGVMGEFEALSSKQGDEGNEKSILRVMVDLKRDEVGRRRVMIGEMWEKAERLRVERASIARQLKEMEARIGRERELKRTMRAEHAEAQRWFEGRVSRVRAMEGGGQRKEERDGLVKKNAVLQRGVEGLKRDIERALQEKQEYEEKIEEVRRKVKQVIW